MSRRSSPVYTLASRHADSDDEGETTYSLHNLDSMASVAVDEDPADADADAGGTTSLLPQQISLGNTSDESAVGSRESSSHDNAVPSPAKEKHSRDYDVPSQIIACQTFTAHRDMHEISKLRYTAVVDDAEDFTWKQGYNLRHNKLSRHTELIVGITYYNEDKSLLCRTLHSAVEACRKFQSLKKHAFWPKGGPATQKLLICITLDGLGAADPGVLDVLAAIGVYRHGLLRKEINGKPVRTHVFEYATELSVTENLEVVGPTQSSIKGLSDAPIQFVVIVKNENCGKLNSYRWLYTSVGGITKPEVVVHLDTGTKIETDALFKVWNRFYQERDLGGVCGELRPSMGGSWKNILNPLVAAQVFEYKVGFQLDRTFEATSGLLALMPGAFSAWRLRGQMGQPLEDTLLGDPTLVIKNVRISPKPWDLNRYLADDRVICFQVVSKNGAKWYLDYDCGAIAKTDVPMNTTDFINQRRRWLNGTFFSTVYVITHWSRVYKSGHNMIRIAVFHIQLLHSILALVLAWFSLAAFMLTTFTVNDIAGDPPADQPITGFPFGKATPVVNAVIQIVYLALILFQFILALGSRPKNHKVGYTISFLIFGFIQIYMILNLVYLTKRLVDFRVENDNGNNYAYINEYYADLGPVTIITGGISIFGVYFLVGILSLDPWHLFTSYAQFLFVSSSYVNILNIFAFSNVHDVSWGQKSKRDDLPRREPRQSQLLRAETLDLSTSQAAGRSTPVTEDRAAIDAEYDIVLANAQAKPAPETPNRKQKSPLATSDALLEFRTILLATYIFSNFFICLVVLNDSLKPLAFLGSTYWHKIRFFRFWLWANSVSFLIRGVGSVWYYVRRYSLAWRYRSYR